MLTKSHRYRIYKPTKALNGSAVQFNCIDEVPNRSRAYECIFLEIAPQVTEGEDQKAFDWTNKKIVMKLGENDILALYNTFEMVRSFEYKSKLLTDPSGFDALMLKMSEKGKGNLVSLFHNDKNKGATSTINVKANGATYGGGFLMSVSKQFSPTDTRSYRISLSPVEILGILAVFDKYLMERPMGKMETE